jgi:O-methyltransferase
MVDAGIGRMIWRAKNMIASAKLSSLARAVVDKKLTYLTPQKLARLEASASGVVEGRIPGDILEFGVALGSTIILADFARRAGRQFHGFDVFGMIPPTDL